MRVREGNILDQFGVEEEPTESLPQRSVTQIPALHISLLVKHHLNIIVDHGVYDVVVVWGEGGVVEDLHHHPDTGQLGPEEGGEEGGGEKGGVAPVED